MFDADRRHGGSATITLKRERSNPGDQARGGAVASRLTSRPEEEGNGADSSMLRAKRLDASSSGARTPISEDGGGAPLKLASRSPAKQKAQKPG